MVFFGFFFCKVKFLILIVLESLFTIAIFMFWLKAKILVCSWFYASWIWTTCFDVFSFSAIGLFVFCNCDLLLINIMINGWCHNQWFFPTIFLGLILMFYGNFYYFFISWNRGKISWFVGWLYDGGNVLNKSICDPFFL